MTTIKSCRRHLQTGLSKVSECFIFESFVIFVGRVKSNSFLVLAFAEYLHRVIRTDMWGYAKDESLDEQDLLKIKYVGIRPAPGYPSQPDHTEKTTMWNAIKAKELAGIELSDSLSMMPAASVSALVFAHPDSTYFAVGQVGKDQVESYAERKKQELAITERWLSPILNYERD